jgi:hypothetical protein
MSAERLRAGGLGIAKLLAIGVAALFALFALLAVLQFGFIYAIYRMVDDWAAVRLGFDIYVSNLIATAFTCVFSVLAPTLAWYLALGRRKAAGIGAIVGLQIVICIAVYTVGSGVCFDRRTGEPLCWFTDTPRGRIWSYSPGFDPVSGHRFRRYTREIRDAEEKAKRGRN